MHPILSESKQILNILGYAIKQAALQSEKKGSLRTAGQKICRPERPRPNRNFPDANASGHRVAETGCGYRQLQKLYKSGG
jgi:hypothetical protein